MSTLQSLRARAIHFSPSVLLLAASIFSGMTSVAIPVHLNAAGLSKLEIVCYFIASAVIVVSYSLGIVPRVARRGYPAGPLRLTTALVPIGTLVLLFGASKPFYLYLGAAVMLLTTTSLPQVFGRVAAANPDSQDGIVFKLRQTMVLGFILGLGLYSAAAFAGIHPLALSAACATCCALTAWSPYFSRSIPVRARVQPQPRTAERRKATATLLVAAIAVVAMMKGVDTLRGIYLPLFAIQSGMPSEAIAPLFIVTAVAELALLPLIGRCTSKWGELRTLAAICALGIIAFCMLFVFRWYGGLLASQVVYAAFAAGFQSIGVVLLARVTGRDVGQGAALFMTVIQTGSILGAVLPLLVPGYQAGIFLIAAALCLVSVGVCLVAQRVEKSTRFA
ncbi:MFS transporter [Frigoribacterium sp. PhB24]|uniref:MFS transporter n=1 Tax=Frigoribacterium sp. PhB24 TaxID=2485204 RepID=UPI0011CD7213|nr:MFS transporter [Frigoribacterium sp. PhB24]